MKKLFSLFITLMLFSFLAVPAYAHVVVRPDSVAVAARQVFTVSVPNEKDNPTIAVRVVMPEGLQSVTPNVKPGWRIDIKKEGTGEDAKVTEVSWTGGSIPAGQRDEFLFQSQAPASTTTLIWKAYQTYQDGTVVSWDQDPKATPAPHASGMDMGDDAVTPYSQTKVVNDLASKPAPADSSTGMMAPAAPQSKLAFGMSAAALALAVISLALVLKKK
jgi:uncharacterized protein YcnI